MTENNFYKCTQMNGKRTEHGNDGRVRCGDDQQCPVTPAEGTSLVGIPRKPDSSANEVRLGIAAVGAGACHAPDGPPKGVDSDGLKPDP